MPITNYYVASDAMGSATAILDKEGNLLERRSYDAFGEMACMEPNGTPVASSTTEIDVGFQGQPLENGSELYQMGFRWYNPSTGRWLNRDPLGPMGGFNLYAFCLNNPLAMNDPTGLAGTASFDKATCTVTITLKYFITIGDGERTLHFNPRRAVLNTEKIFSSEFNGKKCAATCDCPEGIKGRLIMEETKPYAAGSATLMVRYVENMRSFASLGGSTATLYQSNSNYQQMENHTFPHEMGHLMGLNHPGVHQKRPPAPGSDADYVDPQFPDNIMGNGYKLSDDDFKRLYCSHAK